MNKQSEFILEKMVDHFGSWEDSIPKKTIQFTKEHKKIKKKESKRLIKVSNSENTRQRREEMLMFKEEVKLLNNLHLSEMKISNDSYTKKRQEELIYAREILFQEKSKNSFILAS